MPLTNVSSPDDAARAFIDLATQAGWRPDEIIAGLSTGKQESGWRMVWDPTKRWYGYFQQDAGYPFRTDPIGNIRGFVDRMALRRRPPGASDDPFKNIFWLQQRPSEASADDAYNDPAARRAYYTEIKSHLAWATKFYETYKETAVPLDTPSRPDFNEIDQIGWDAADPHGSVRSRPPTNFFLHTEEPRGSGLGASYDSAATNLASYLRGTKGTAAVSYHYTVRQATDGGVTVVDVIDTDLYSWAVLNANVFSINLCFAGSKASWSREQWMTQSKAIDVAAYLAVQDARKYNFSTEVIFPPYGAARAGISDHRYVTKVIGVGNHTDVGGPMAPPWTNFPWDYCKERVDYWLNVDNPAAQPPPVIVVPPAPRVWPRDFTDRELLDYVAAQLGDGDPAWVAKGSTLRDKLWAIAGKVGV